MSKSDSLLSDITLGLSLSESPDIKARGFSEIHFKDVFIEFSRYMLACGATVAYGGDFRSGGFTETLFELKAVYKGNANKIVSYLGWPIHAEMHKLPPKEQLKYKESVEFVKSPIPSGVDESIPRDKFLPPIKTNLDSMLIWARSMTQMRRSYLAERNDAQILLGGRMTGYSGKYPGLVEEAYEIMRVNKPLFLIGAFGGATQAVIDAVSGQRPESLTEEGQYELWDEFEADTHEQKAAKAKADLQQGPQRIKAAEEEIAKANAQYDKAADDAEKHDAIEKIRAAENNKKGAEKALESAKNYNPDAKLQNYRGFVEYFNFNAPQSEERIEYSMLTDFFNEKGIAGLNNNLTPEENQRLFVTPHVAEMIALTLKGLSGIKK